jgi:cell division protein FtsB
MKFIKNIIFIFLLLFLFSSLLRNLFSYKSKLDFYEQFKQNFEKEKKRNIQLKTEVVRKKSIEEIEKIIRNDLNLLKDNEIALIIPSPPMILISPTPTPAPNWKQWWVVYFGKN